MTAVPFIDSTVLKTGCSVGFRCSVLSFMLVLNLGLSSKEKCPYFAGDSRIFLPPSIQGGPKKRGHRLVSIILSNLYRFTSLFSLEDSLVNLQLNAY